MDTPELPQNRRRVLVLVAKECYLDECEEGNLIKLHPNDSHNSTHDQLFRITSNIKALRKSHDLDRIEIQRVSISNADSKCVRIDVIPS